MNRLMILGLRPQFYRIGMLTVMRAAATKTLVQPKTIKVKRPDGTGYDEFKVPEVVPRRMTPPITDFCQIMMKYMKTPELTPFTFLLVIWFIGFLVVANASFRKVEIDIWHERSRLMDWECIRNDYFLRPVVLYSPNIDCHRRLPKSVEETLDKMLEETIRRRELRGGRKRRKMFNFF